jgi:DNA-binding CsgD family transcriptional regulator
MSRPTPARDRTAHGYEIYPGTSLAGRPLSPREKEVLERVCLGRSNAETAGDLGIAEQSIKNHMTAILRKLNANSRTEAALIYTGRHDPADRAWVLLQAAFQQLDALRREVDATMAFVQETQARLARERHH